MSKNLICPGLKVYSKQGKENFDMIFTKNKCTRDNCPKWKEKGTSCEYLKNLEYCSLGNKGNKND